MPRLICSFVAALALCAAAFPSLAQESSASADQQANVRVTVRMGRLDAGKRSVLKTYDVLVVTGSSGSKMLSGARVPIPTAKDDGGTQYTYQNIGFTIDVKAWLVGDKQIKLMGVLEDSRLREAAAGQPPVVETRQLSLNVLLADGTPAMVARVEGEQDAPGYVEIEARIVR